MDAMPIDWGLVFDIGVPLLCLIVGAAIDQIFERRPKLITYYGHVSSFTLQGAAGAAGTSTVHTHSVVVSNSGRKTATNVRVGHHYLPSYQLWPEVAVKEVELPGGGTELVLPTLVPGEQLTISYLYFPPFLVNNINSYVKSDEAMASVITVLPTRQYPKWVLAGARCLLFVGVTATLYAAVALVRALI